ncbi:MAG TPA: sigma-70 family RNA polymerase sigma factor [Thermoguttaceae bacterium]|nr:sigma-70 family RNA polymerase sigma factor [Thermoguttaceae bacterium]
MDEDRSVGPKAERFVRLLATCQRRVFLYALGLVSNAADAEEILQETNLVLWRKFDQYQPGTDFARWACRIAHFEVLKFRERRAQQRRLFTSEFIEALAVDSEESLDELDARREALAACLEKLRKNDRQLVLRRYQERATTRSVAEALGRSVQGTRKSLHRIRMALLACIERTLAAEEHP